MGGRARHDPPWKGIRPIGLHDSRQTAVLRMLDADVPIDKLSMVHGPRLDRCHDRTLRHLLPGGEAEAAKLLDSYQAAGSANRSRCAHRVDGAPAFP
jgi:hypothetical protein